MRSAWRSRRSWRRRHQCAKQGTGTIVFADVSGHPFFFLAPGAQCAGACLEKWHPAVAPANAVAIKDWTLVSLSPGQQQWAFQGKPLYTAASGKLIDTPFTTSDYEQLPFRDSGTPTLKLKDGEDGMMALRVTPKSWIKNSTASGSPNIGWRRANCSQRARATSTPWVSRSTHSPARLSRKRRCSRHFRRSTPLAYPCPLATSPSASAPTERGNGCTPAARCTAAPATRVLAISMARAGTRHQGRGRSCVIPCLRKWRSKRTCWPSAAWSKRAPA